jgi:hypothetical protein
MCGNPVFLHQAGDPGFNLLHGKHLHAPREVFHGIKPAPARHNSHSKTIHSGVKQVIPVSLGVHPGIVDLSRLLSIRNVLFKEAEMRTRLPGTVSQTRFTWILVRNRTLGSHARAMIQRGSRQRRIPLQRIQPARNANLVGQREQLFCLVAERLAVADL